MDLPMAVGVQQLQVVERRLTTKTAPNPMVQVPGLLLNLQRLPAHQALTALSLPDIVDPAPPRKSVAHLPGHPLLQVQFPRRIVRVGCTPNLLPPEYLDPGCFHQ